MALKTIIFDFDGTLHDSMRIYPLAFKAAYTWLVEQGWARPRTFADDEIAGYIGLTVQEMWTSFRPDLPVEVQQQAAAQVGRTMDELIEDGTARLFAGVPEMLAAVKGAGFQLVFLSNCRVAYQQAARKAFDLDAWFDGYYNSEEYGGVPKEVIFEDIARVFPGEYAVVGDRMKDLAIARVHGLASVGCLYGYGSHGELADATYLADAPEDIPGLITRIARI